MYCMSLSLQFEFFGLENLGWTTPLVKQRLRLRKIVARSIVEVPKGGGINWFEAVCLNTLPFWRRNPSLLKTLVEAGFKTVPPHFLKNFSQFWHMKWVNYILVCNVVTLFTFYLYTYGLCKIIASQKYLPIIGGTIQWALYLTNLLFLDFAILFFTPLAVNLLFS